MKYLGQTSSGSLADSTFSRNRYGQYQRRRATPVNLSTAVQTAVRQRLSALSAAWGALDASAKAAWGAYASAHPRTDALGQSITLDGHAMYVSLNAALQVSEFTGISSPPSQEPIWPSLVLGFTMTAGTPTASVTFSGLTTNYAVQIWAGKQGSPGVTFDKNLRLIDTIVLSDTSPLDVLAAYQARWGAPKAGARFHYAFRRIWGAGAIDVFLTNYGTTGA